MGEGVRELLLVSCGGHCGVVAIRSGRGVSNRAIVGLLALSAWICWLFVLIGSSAGWLWALRVYGLLALSVVVVGAIVWENAE